MGKELNYLGDADFEEKEEEEEEDEEEEEEEEETRRNLSYITNQTISTR